MRFDLAVPDLIEAYGEAEKHDARELERYEFTVISLEGEEVEGVVVFLGQHAHDARGLGALSVRIAGIRPLDEITTACQGRKHTYVTTHGRCGSWITSWCGVLSPPEAVAAVRRLQSSGRGFTQVECDKFTDKWVLEPS